MNRTAAGDPVFDFVVKEPLREVPDPGEDETRKNWGNQHHEDRIQP